ncbi:hypothetical protein SAMN04488082_10880 [Desulfomicrobium apsheronum]|uniref:Uncharacterized protein n=1 Tax=Desulfomicrobium apsheronum TaxID=52560 RepID=A0A1I3UQR9_9BACT|nr:hypothetical protein SAMN04488082_10880 [Desulfomicrobium apsheronum]
MPGSVRQLPAPARSDPTRWAAVEQNKVEFLFSCFGTKVSRPYQGHSRAGGNPSSPGPERHESPSARGCPMREHLSSLHPMSRLPEKQLGSPSRATRLAGQRWEQNKVEFLFSCYAPRFCVLIRVIPAQAGIHLRQGKKGMNSHLRGDVPCVSICLHCIPCLGCQ